MLPRFAQPDDRWPAFWKPELPTLPKALFQKPELLPPTLPKPDALPVPELKNPDDGAAVEFPKPGAAGI
ncbi:hypothetical protein LAUMK191_02105 [Mycobacterium attenuatum]|nr:hypothetical protein LAUMK191_02105 [Mycobacterium attenuatum]